MGGGRPVGWESRLLSGRVGPRPAHPCPPLRWTDRCPALLPPLLLPCPHSLWFTPRLEVEDGGHLERSAADRAQQLADVALAVYEAGGALAGWALLSTCAFQGWLRGGARTTLIAPRSCARSHPPRSLPRRPPPWPGRAIHLPLEQGHPLVAVLRAALGVGARGDLKKEWAAGREVAGALLDLLLAAEEGAEGGEGEQARGAGVGGCGRSRLRLCKCAAAATACAAPSRLAPLPPCPIRPLLSTATLPPPPLGLPPHRTRTRASATCWPCTPLA